MEWTTVRPKIKRGRYGPLTLNVKTCTTSHKSTQA